MGLLFYQGRKSLILLWKRVREVTVAVGKSLLSCPLTPIPLSGGLESSPPDKGEVEGVKVLSPLPLREGPGVRVFSGESLENCHSAAR
jgi:hypothetical protein